MTNHEWLSEHNHGALLSEGSDFIKNLRMAQIFPKQCKRGSGGKVSNREGDKAKSNNTRSKEYPGYDGAEFGYVCGI